MVSATSAEAVLSSFFKNKKMGGLTLLNVLVSEKGRIYDIDLYNKGFDIGDAARYTLMIGSNGVGKSYLLRAIIDFWFEYVDYKERGKDSLRVHRNNRFTIVELVYSIKNRIVRVRREKSGFVWKMNENIIDESFLVKPNIIAVHFGLYGRFPEKTRMTNRDYYKYVGPKAASNFITSNNVITQMVSTLCSIENIEVEQRLNTVFHRMGYESRLSIIVSVNGRMENSMSLESLKDRIKEMLERPNSFLNSAYNKVRYYTELQWRELYATCELVRSSGKQFEIELDWNRRNGLKKHSLIYRYLYLLKQLRQVNIQDYLFYKSGQAISCAMLSSGEINLMATVISIASLVNNDSNIVLIDEPELSQHPNWQMGMISQLDEILSDFPCHFIIATHSHLLVSDLPMGRSCVIHLEQSDEGLSTMMINEDTYGWSAEDVLLQVFHTATDRNKYFGNIVGNLLERIGKNDISKQEVEEELDFISQVSRHMHNDDPMKLIVETIIKAYRG